MKSIVVIFPHFGTLPPQYKMWRASALCNTDIDFLFFTDCDVEPARNILVNKISFNQFKEMIQKKFDFPIILDRPYKICEYRPAFAYALEEYIKGYDFWGWGDLDVVYGNIRSFITEEVLSKYHMISGWGHFSLYHNDVKTNTYFMDKHPGYQYYKDAFSTSETSFFDEFGHKGFADKWYDLRHEECWLDWPFDNVSKPKQSYNFCSLNRGWDNVLFEYDNGSLYIIRISDGIIERVETLYAHFQHRLFMKDKVTNYNHFLVTPRSIIDYPRHL